MTHYRHDPAFLKIVDAMIETVEFDVNGRAGQGGNGGLTSDKAIRLSGEARIMRDRIRKTEAGLFPIEIAPELKAQPVFFVAYDDDKDRHHTWNIESEDFEAANSHCQQFQAMYVGKPFPNGQGHYPYQTVRVLVSDKIVTLNVDALDLPETAPHPDDVAVNNFAMAMGAKMTISRVQKGRGGWEDKQQCTQQELSIALLNHMRKGDPVDVANFAMMLHQRGETIALPPQTVTLDLRTIGAEAMAELIELAKSDVGGILETIPNDPPQDVVNLVIAAREFWDANNDLSKESTALDKALEAFSSCVPYDDQPGDEAHAVPNRTAPKADKQ